MEDSEPAKAPVEIGSAEYMAKGESQVPEDETFLYRYFQHKQELEERRARRRNPEQAEADAEGKEEVEEEEALSGEEEGWEDLDEDEEDMGDDSLLLGSEEEDEDGGENGESGAPLPSAFADAEQFAHLLDESGGGDGSDDDDRRGKKNVGGHGKKRDRPARSHSSSKPLKKRARKHE